MDSASRAAARRWFEAAGFRGGEAAFALAFCALVVLVPLVAGDLYPFTTGPMFAERFERFCEYRVLAPSGDELDVASFALQHNHGGNPLGYRGGFEGPPTLHPFGQIGSEAQVRSHVSSQLRRRPGLPFVTVVQTTIAPRADGSVGPVQVLRWRVQRPAAP